MSGPFRPPEDVAATLQERHLAASMLALWQITLSQHPAPSTSPTIAAVYHDEPITFQGDGDVAPVTYEPWPIHYDSIRITSDGSQHGLQLSIANLNPIVIEQIEASDSLLRGMPVRMYLVSKEHLDAASNARPFSFVVESPAYSHTAVTLTLAAVRLWDLKLPHKRIQREVCNYAFRGPRCRYSEPASVVPQSTHCDGTYAQCTAYGAAEVARGEPRQHPLRWGGRPGLPKPRRRG